MASAIDPLDVITLVVGVVSLALTWGGIQERRRIPVILAMLARASAPQQAADVAVATRLPLHSVYLILQHLDDVGWVKSETRPGGPGLAYYPRLLYGLTLSGRSRLERASR